MASIAFGTVRAVESSQRTIASLRRQQGANQFLTGKITCPHATLFAEWIRDYGKDDLALVDKVAQRALQNSPKEARAILTNTSAAHQADLNRHWFKNWLLSFCLVAFIASIFVAKKLDVPAAEIQSKCDRLNIAASEKELNEVRSLMKPLFENNSSLINGPMTKFKIGNHTYLIGKGRCLLAGDFSGGHGGQVKGQRRFLIDVMNGQTFIEFSTKRMQEQTVGSERVLEDVASQEKDMLDKVKGIGIAPEILVNEMTGENHSLIMEFCEEGDLEKYLTTHKDLSEKEKLHIALGVIRVLKELHKNHIVHNDVKPANFVITRDAKGKIIPKLIDFGVSLPLEEASQIKDIGVTGDMLHGIYSDSIFGPVAPPQGTPEHVFFRMAVAYDISLEEAEKLLMELT